MHDLSMDCCGAYTEPEATVLITLGSALPFPDDPEPSGLGVVDRKFVAAAAPPERPSILQTYDSKCLSWSETLLPHGVKVEVLCPNEIARIWAAKSRSCLSSSASPIRRISRGSARDVAWCQSAVGRRDTSPDANPPELSVSPLNTERTLLGISSTTDTNHERTLLLGAILRRVGRPPGSLARPTARTDRVVGCPTNCRPSRF